MSQSVTPGRDQVAALRTALDRFDDCQAVATRWGVALAARLGRGARLLAAGNGGSAAQAQHLTAELVGRFREERGPFSAVCLTSDTATLTALANDYGAPALFARQVRAHARPGDVLMLLSTSGRSTNLVSAAHAATQSGAAVWAMTGPEPNPLTALADEWLAVDSPRASTVQELHLLAVHLMCGAFDAALRPAHGPVPHDVGSLVPGVAAARPATGAGVSR
jgi:D-sedoheptulose 7-phosphate isomerase